MGTNIKRYLRKDDAKMKLKNPNRNFTRQDSFRLVCYKSSGSAAAGPDSVTVSVRTKRGMGKRREVGQLACSRAPPLSRLRLRPLHQSTVLCSAVVTRHGERSLSPVLGLWSWKGHHHILSSWENYKIFFVGHQTYSQIICNK